MTAATGQTGALYKKGTAKNAGNFDQTNDTGYTLGHVASKVVWTLTRPVSTSGEKPERKYQSVVPALIEGGLPSVTDVTNMYNDDNNKNAPVVDTEDGRLTMNIYMKIYGNHKETNNSGRWMTRRYTTPCSITVTKGPW